MTRLRWLALVCAGVTPLLNFLMERALMPVSGDTIIIPGLLDFHPAWNRGVSFSLFWQSETSGRYLLSAVLFAFVIFIGVLAWRSSNKLAAAGFGLVMGGALGNLLDRTIFGAVFDYLFLHAGTRPLFVCNFSDIAISGGVVLLVANELIGPKTEAVR